MKKPSLKPESVQQNHKEWIGVDLDGTLAYYDYWRGKEDIGPPIPKMLMRIKQWIAEGKIVKIFTARATQDENIPRRRYRLRAAGSRAYSAWTTRRIHHRW